MKKNGFTLIELLVYIAILGFIVVVAGRAFSDSTAFRVRSQNMVKSSEIGNRALNILREDMMQMGAKDHKKDIASSDDQSIFREDSVYWNKNQQDISSFAIGQDNTSNEAEKKDTISLRYIHYNDKGIYQSVREVKWYVKRDSLLRICKRIAIIAGGTDDGCSETPDTVVIAEKIQSFKLSASRPNNGDTAIYSSTPGTFYLKSSKNNSENISYSDSKVIISSIGIDEIYLFDNNNNIPAGQVKSQCKAFTFEKGETYTVEFTLSTTTDKDNNIRNFIPERDYITAGFRSKSSAGNNNIIQGIPDFTFYPPQTKEQSSSLQNFDVFFPKKITADACFAFTFSVQWPADGGTLEISGLSIKRKSKESWHFDETPYYPATSAKSAVRAFKVNLDINVNGEVSKLETVIPTPNNGS